MLIPFLIINLQKIQFYTSMNACIKFVGRARLTLLFVIGITIQAYSQQRVSLFSSSNEPIPVQLKKDLTSMVRVKPNISEINRIWNEEPSTFQLQIPMPGGNIKELIFQKKKITSSGFRVVSSDGKVLTGKEVEGVHYQIDGKSGKEKVGNLSFSKGEMRGVFSDDYGNWNIGVLPNGKGDYIIFSDRDLAVQSGFRCETPDGKDPMPYKETDPKEGGNDKTTGSCRTVKVYFECDFKMYQDNGSSVANTSNVVTGMFNCVKQLYENEQINVEISEIFVWTSTDPFAALTSSSTYLLNFATARTTFNGTIAHFLTTRATSYGGMAYVNVLCNPSARYAFSNIYNTYSALPTYSWTVGCVAHEMGHNFSSKHTHWCGWQLTPTTIGKIDSCWTGETVSGSVNCSTSNKANPRGTVMSYCHLNGAINFNFGFGPLPGNAIRAGFAAASCVTGNPVPSFSVTGTRAVCTGSTINLATNTAVTGANFNWTGPNSFSSTSQNPSITNASLAAAGDYSCTVSKSGCTSDPKKVNIVVNDPDTPPLTEGFEGTVPSAKWKIVNPHNDRTWAAFSGVGGFGTSTKCIRMDNFNSPDPRGRRDSLFTPVLSLSGRTGTSLTFDVAYAWNGAYYDTLKVLVSGNCGRTFTQLYKKTSTALATAPINSGAFTPTAAQWRKETIDLSAYDGTSVQVVFVNVAGWSNFLYLDNIGLTTTGTTSSNSITLNSLAQSTFCPGASVSVGFSTTGSFNSGNSFSVQLSNASGSFASPTTIGSGTTSPISATIPAGTGNGSGYLIRVVATNPAVISNTSSSITVSPFVVSAGSAQTVCTNSNPITLSGTPSGGTWSGNGVTSGGVFTPTTALAGTQTLTYSASSSGCSNSGTVVITVNAPPSVSAGSNQSICSNAAPLTLTGQSPSGGTWTGNGVSSGGIFTPSLALAGTQTLTYTVSSNGCSATANRSITVVPEITINAGANQSVCSNGAAISLSGTPAGGTWSGTGVTSGGVFTPSTSLVGARVLTYSITGTCGGSSNVTITVNATPTVNAGIDQSFCANDGPFALTQGSPSGGVWSGPGVSSGNFVPSVSLIGSHTLTYSVTQNGCTASGQADFTVNAIPTPSAGPDRQACSGSGMVVLTGSPAGGTWSGNGVSGSGNFTPSTSNLGDNTLTYSISQNGCTGTSTMVFTVYANPVVSAGPNQTANANVNSVQLTGTPAGGTWTGTAVSPGGDFSPSAAGIGTFTLTYTVAQNGCSASSQMIFTVNPAVVVYAGPNQNVCASSNPITLNGTPVGGTWSGNGVSPSGIFTPNTSLVGTQVLTYTVSGVGSSTLDMTVIPNPVVNAGANQTVCSTAPNFTLSGATPAGGTWSGTGISVGGVVFVNQLVPSGSTFNYTVSQNGCSGSASLVITPVAPPTANAGANQNICKNASPIQLVGSPAGGIWSGNGINASGLFDPSMVAVGNTTLTYTVTGSLAGCNGVATTSVTVFSLPSVNAGPDRSTCSNANPFNLSGSPTGGTWSGVGVSPSGLFSPSAGLVGVQTVTYTISQNGCSNSATTNVTVNALPVVSAGSSSSICTNSPNFSLSGATPSGGSWSGAAFINSSGLCTGPFSAGSYQLTYTVTQNGCTATDQLSLTVNAVPTVNPGTNRNICANAANLTLNGFSPSGGIWTGNGVSPSGVFSPSLALIGNQTLTYTFIQNGCAGSGQITVTVKNIPSITTGPNETHCESGIIQKISGYQPRGGKWSGPGVLQDSLFSPGPALIGTQTLTYTITKNGCSNSAQKTVTVNQGNAITPGTYPTQICANALPTYFSGFLPAGGTWKGSGMGSTGLLTPGPSLVGIQYYTYRLDLNGCRDSLKIQTTINAVPLVTAGPDITICASGSPVALTNATPVGGTWSGQGVNEGGIFTPSAVPAGSYPLVYSYTENGCTGTATRMAIVQSAPTVSAGPDKTICKNSIPVALTGSPFGGTWSGNGVSATGLFTPTSTMSGNINLTYSINENGCTGSSTMVVSITNAIAINAGANQNICDNSNAINLTGFSPAGGTWTGNGVSPTGQFNPANAPLGQQTLTYTVTQNNCTVKDTKTITVNAAPVAVAGPDQNVCSNEAPVQLSGFSPAGGTWSGTGVSAAGLFTPPSSQTGMIPLSYKVIANGCTTIVQKIVTVIAAPVVDAGADLTACSSSETITMSGYFPSGGTWTGNGISGAGIFQPNGQTGLFTFTYSITQNGCTNQDQKALNILDFPVSLPLQFTTNTECQGHIIPVNLNLPAGNPFSIQWIRNGQNLPGATAATLLATQSGTYKAKVSQSVCSIESDGVVLTFNPTPSTPTISQNAYVLSSSSPSGNQWRRNGQDIPGANSSTFTVNQSGIYSVIVVQGGCSSDPSIGLPVTFTEVDAEEEEEFQINVFPNPNEGRFRLEMEGVRVPSVEVMIIDGVGKLVWSEVLSTEGLKISTELHFPKLASGIYWLKVPIKDQMIMRKMVIR